MKPYLYIDENMGLPDRGMALRAKSGPRGVFTKKFGTLVDLGITLEVQLLRLRSHRPLKTSCSAQWSLNGLGANVRWFARITPPPCYDLMWWVKISNDNMGEGHHPHGVVKARSSGAALALLSPPFPAQNGVFRGRDSVAIR